MARSATTFKPGQSGNPAGKPKHARNRITLAFLNALADHFDKYGKTAIDRAYKEDPVSYVKVCASLLPKQVEQSQPLDDLTDAELVAGIALLRSRLAGGAGEGSEPAPIPSQVN
jgi:hypothetical protein